MKKEIIAVIIVAVLLIFGIILIVNKNQVCQPNFNCSSWSSCLDNQQNRICTKNSCSNETPILIKGCNQTICPMLAKICPDGSSVSANLSNNCEFDLCLNQTTNENLTNLTCIEDWQCGSWSICSNNLQTRTCVDANRCGTILNKPSLTQSCSVHIFETNEVGGYTHYIVGTWVKLDTNEDGNLETFNYQGRGITTDGSCPGTFYGTTPEGYQVKIYNSKINICNPQINTQDSFRIYR